MCQVPGCTADLETTGKPYCSVKRICPEHMKADAIPCSSGLMRYCQQCGVLEPLALFDDIKRSCRDSLCRRQPQQLSGMAPGTTMLSASPAPYAAASCGRACIPGLPALGGAAGWVPTAASGGQAQAGAALHVQQGPAPAAAAAAEAEAAAPAARGQMRARMMARLEERLQALAAQMGDMQLMLRLLQDA
ncbi:hypothetical protein OEZ86_002269 [Tetradesmus obliquus]|nr:hypothetical protein OEZ86_002269 [Tetradesmus obliquus]